MSAPQEFALDTRRIYILPSRSGLLLFLVLVALLLGSVNYSNALGYLLTFLLASMATVSLLHTQRNLLHLKVSVVPGEPVFAGEAAAFRICLHNNSAARHAIRVEARAGGVQTFNLPAHDTHCVLLSLPAKQRGWFVCPDFVLATIYPLGITRAWTKRIHLPARCLVYPSPAESAELHYASGSDGESRPGTRFGEEDFSGLRTYQAGDTPARISWKTLARGQGMHTKEFSAPQAESVLLDWDNYHDADDEIRLSRLCRALLDADRAGLMFGLRLPGVMLEVNSGPDHRRRCLEALALYGITR